MQTASNSRRLFTLLYAFSWLILFQFSSSKISAQDVPVKRAPVKIAFLANRGEVEGKQRWQPTADYLTANIPGYAFEAVPLSFDDIFSAVEHHEVDFVVANSGIYVRMEVEYGVARIATLKNLRSGAVCKTFAGVIFALARRTDIQGISDLKGKTFMAVDEDSLGGWQMAWRELKAEGVDPYHDLTRLEFGGTHDAVIHAVRDGKIDAGTVRTDLFERISAEGKIDLNSFRILNPQPKTPDFPFLRSTRLYPEWPFSKLKHTSDELSQQVAIALLKMPADSHAAKASECVGWTVPLDYTEVHHCLQEVGAPPYLDYGKVTAKQVFRQYRFWFVCGVVALIMLIAAVVYVSRLNRNLTRLRASLETELTERKRIEVSLQQAHVELESRVEARTADLAQANRGLIREIEVRKRAEEDRARSGAVLEATTDIVGMADATQRTIYLNRAARKLLGFNLNEDISNRRIADFHPEWARKLIQGIAIPTVLRDGVWMGESAFLSAEGQEIPVSQILIAHRDTAGNVEYFSTIARDIRERVKLEEQLRYSQKMEAVGQLAGGVAHDFNNLLSVILGCAEMMESRTELGATAKQDLEIVKQAVQRGSNMTRQLLAFSRRLPVIPRILDLNGVIRSLEPVLRRAMGEDYRFETRLAPGLKTVRADQSQLEQVLLNLCINARDAMKPGGKLEILTANVHWPTITPELPEGLSAGTYVNLSVIDTGSGIDPAIRSRIFEPFFTTKEKGKGTGLGLSTVYGIVKQCGGAITVQSELDQGSTFNIYFPGLDQPVESAETVPTIASKPASATILLAEDEEPVRNVLARFLNAKGFNVLEAEDGLAAVRIAEEYQNQIDLLITDMVMPGMQGHELARQMTSLRPDIKIIFISGYMPAQEMRDEMVRTGAPFIQKPFTPSLLVEKVRELMKLAK